MTLKGILYKYFEIEKFSTYKNAGKCKYFTVPSIQLQQEQKPFQILLRLPTLTSKDIQQVYDRLTFEDPARSLLSAVVPYGIKRVMLGNCLTLQHLQLQAFIPPPSST